jgi:predicted secreted hydrolase
MSTHPMFKRRHLLGSLLAGLSTLPNRRPSAQPASSPDPAQTTGQPAAIDERALRLEPAYPQVLPGMALIFPRDHGAHPAFRIEWWYITGWLQPAAGGTDQAFGLQITFFRVRTGHPMDNPSRFSPAQLLVAHAALAEPGRGRLLHLEQAARPGFGLANASIDDTGLQLGRWSLVRGQDDRYLARVTGRGLDLELSFTPPGPPILQGDDGFSPKGPRPQQASYYYSRPWLDTTGRVNGRPVRGSAWFDHEWSSELLDPQAQGWDWAGLHLDDGRALMVFRIRDRQGGTLWTQSRWIQATELRTGNRILSAPPDRTQPSVTPSFSPVRHWQSPRTGVHWPVAMAIQLGELSLLLEPLLDDQELDTRAATGVLYWEGAVRVRDGAGRSIGRGYLELTGYGEALRI